MSERSSRCAMLDLDSTKPASRDAEICHELLLTSREVAKVELRRLRCIFDAIHATMCRRDRGPARRWVCRQLPQSLVAVLVKLRLVHSPVRKLLCQLHYHLQNGKHMLTTMKMTFGSLQTFKLNLCHLNHRLHVQVLAARSGTPA